MKNYKATFTTQSKVLEGRAQQEKHQSKDLFLIPQDISISELQEVVMSDLDFPITIDLEHDIIL